MTIINQKIQISIMAIIVIISIASCTNYEPEKGNHYKDLEDTVKKDSVQPEKKVAPDSRGDSAQ